ncbi:MAG: cobalamin-dependent protein [Acidimicrobiales bacterium]|jgi:methanogenic corrinoid protein MtbC1
MRRDANQTHTATLADEFEKTLLVLDRLGAERLLREAGLADRPAEVLEDIVVPALTSIGAAWEDGDIALSQVYMSGRICQDVASSVFIPVPGGRHGQPTLAIAVLEDAHTLGKTIVLSLLRASGYEVLDFGSCRGIEEIAEMTERNRVEVLMISTLMLRAALRVGELRTCLDRAGLPTKLVVGGAPFRFDDMLWKEVGADSFGRNASDALAVLSQIESER